MIPVTSTVSNISHRQPRRMATCSLPSNNSIMPTRLISTKNLHSILIILPLNHHSREVRLLRLSVLNTHPAFPAFPAAPASPASPASRLDRKEGLMLRLEKTRRRTATSGVLRRTRSRSISLSLNPKLRQVGMLNG